MIKASLTKQVLLEYAIMYTDIKKTNLVFNANRPVFECLTYLTNFKLFIFDLVGSSALSIHLNCQISLKDLQLTYTCELNKEPN